MTAMPGVRIGTCSWKFPSWAGLVYSAPKGINYLEEYVRHYETVEVDQWFWSLFEGSGPRLPNPADVAAYRDAVPEGFRFTVKAPNSITLTHYHPRSRSDPLVPNPHYLSPDLFAEFLALLEPLGERLGPVILQFGYLNRRHVTGQGEFLGQLETFLGAIPAGPGLALEIRNPRWLNADQFESMLDHRLFPVLLEGYWMPPVVQVYRDWRDVLGRSGTVVVRLHGPDREGMEKDTGKQWNRLVAQRDEELAAIVGMARELVEGGADVYLNVNNHYEGSAPLTIRRIEELLAEGAEQ